MDEETKEVCMSCGGLGFVSVKSRVWPNEPHEADLGEVTPCICKLINEDENE